MLGLVSEAAGTASCDEGARGAAEGYGCVKALDTLFTQGDILDENHHIRDITRSYFISTYRHRLIKPSFPSHTGSIVSA